MKNDALFRWIVKTLGMLLIILVAVVTINQSKTLHGPLQTISISADGKVTGVPDLATVRIGVTSDGVNLIDVKNQNNLKMNQVINFIKQQGIDKQDIQTTDFSASPKYNYDNGQSNIVGYQANQMITVHVHHINQSRAQLEKILDGAVNNGANQIQGVDFSFSNPDALRQQARKLAIEKAKKKATELTQDAGLHLGPIVNVIESGMSGNSPMPMAMMGAARVKSVAPDIQPGSQDVIESITLVFEIY